MISVIIPTYNGASRIGDCLSALAKQKTPRRYEVIVVDDGSTDDTAAIAAGFDDTQVIRQPNAGPAGARNRGAEAASGDIIVFIDDDCVADTDWLERMVEPFDREPDIVGTKGRYRTQQRSLTSRFVQAEYEDKYRVMARHRYIDFIDTYAAGYRRHVFLDADGYDTAFPVPSAEDIDLSYRLSSDGHKMVFCPDALVAHLHPESFSIYFRKKFRFAYWRMLAVRNTPEKAVRDSHTPQLMKFQVLLGPTAAGIAAISIAAGLPTMVGISGFAAFAVTTIPFSARALAKDPVLGVAAPLILLGRSFFQFAGVAAGLLRIFRANGG